ncbi:hypothetical protein BASA50_005708 [Batrachochytrium salamandrivorans]|uniref:RING-type domain-containing protein n=1 Tax=Batrachochytrium salamandrivorans TaxID=1357716 RepID=A0ABQ8FC12_9FUNG|nr:hypothetical protein BASA61_003798 [Batrachochytrium salamandrivorans]KAH6595626.1 hypothetical protein BASA50_005708 [Batrachochytrium salamandrivorans]
MDKRYLNSTATELATMDRVCIICREEMVAVPGNAPPAEAVGIAARTAVGVVGAGGVAHRINPNTPKRLPCGRVFHFRCLRSWLERQQACPTCRRSVMDIPAQAPVQPAIVNPVAAVNPIVANANDNVPQPVGAFQHLGAPPVQMEFPGGHGVAQAPIYLITLGPAPLSMLMPQNSIGRIQAQLAGITEQFNQMLHMLPTETHVDESQKHK